MRQWYKHVVGIETTSSHPTKDHAWNEISLRYVDAGDFDYYIPQGGFRKQAEDNKQASTDEVIQSEALDAAYKLQCDEALKLYNTLISQGVAREQARGVLPLNIYTEFYWSVSLQALVNFIHLRKHPGAQYEIRLYAEALEKFVQRVVPVSYQALLGVSS